MHAVADNTTTSQSQLPPPSKLVRGWLKGRSQYTPWAPSRLRRLAVVRLAVSVFLVGLGATLISYHHDLMAVIPLAGAALVFTIGSLDLRASRYVSRRS
jgi:hypothetical protein